MPTMGGSSCERHTYHIPWPKAFAALCSPLWQASLPAGDAEASAQSTKPAPSSRPTSEGQDGALRPDEATHASDGVVGADAQSANRGVSSGGGSSDAAPGVTSVADCGGGGSRSLKGAAPDGDNSRAASTLRERLGR